MIHVVPHSLGSGLPPPAGKGTACLTVTCASRQDVRPRARGVEVCPACAAAEGLPAPSEQPTAGSEQAVRTSLAGVGVGTSLRRGGRMCLQAGCCILHRGVSCFTYGLLCVLQADVTRRQQQLRQMQADIQASLDSRCSL